jgi:hypothetical protein
MIDGWTHKTLEELDNLQLGHPEQAPTGLVKRCMELCRTPLYLFSVDDLRLMIGQQFSLSFLVPLAVIELGKNLLAEGGLYEGDLLESVLSVREEYWHKDVESYRRIYDLISSKLDQLDALRIDYAKFITLSHYN